MSTTKNTKKVQSTLEKLQPSLHPVKEHPLSNCEEFVQKLYITQLCVMAEYENEDVENSLKFVQRIMAGAKMKENITEYRKNAMEMKLEQIEEFILQCKENKLCDIFIIDSLLLTMGNGKANQKQVGYLAEMAEALGINKKRMGYLCEIAVCILEQDSEKYQKVSAKIPHDVRNEIVECVIGYLKEFVVGVLVDTDEMFYVYAPEKTEITMKEVFEYHFHNDDKTKWNGSFEVNMKHIVMENLIFSPSEDFWWYPEFIFKGCSSVVIENCELGRKGFGFDRVRKVVFSNCFADGKENNRVDFWITTYNTKETEIEIRNCLICNMQYDDSFIIGGCRYNEKAIVKIKDSEFRNISTQKGWPIVYNYGLLEVNHSKFENCATKSSKLFWDGIDRINREDSEFINCSKI